MNVTWSTATDLAFDVTIVLPGKHRPDGKWQFSGPNVISPDGTGPSGLWRVNGGGDVILWDPATSQWSVTGGTAIFYRTLPFLGLLPYNNPNAPSGSGGNSNMSGKVPTWNFGMTFAVNQHGSTHPTKWNCQFRYHGTGNQPFTTPFLQYVIAQIGQGNPPPPP